VPDALARPFFGDADRDWLRYAVGAIVDTLDPGRSDARTVP
jgi:hypothetical protein